MKPIIIITFLLSMLYSPIYSQNLINNPGFDEYDNYIDSNHNLVYHPKYWNYKDSVLNHPIYFSADRFKNKSLVWNCHPDSALVNKGENVNYISVLIVPNTQKAYTVLKEPLIKNQQYHLSIDIKAFDQSNYLSDLLVGFKDCFNCNIDSNLYQLRLNIPDSLCNDSLYYRWVTLKADFIAQGNEKVFIISSCTANDYLQIINSNPTKYLIRKYDGIPKLKYYIDNIHLFKNEILNDSLKLNKLDSLDVGETFILNNIYFDFDKSDILQQSYKELNAVYNFLAKYSKVKIQISGHTDNYGTDDYNKTLSYKRALSVVSYFTDKGIAPNRLEAKGFGSEKPITTNNTTDGRQMNRRIEMKILEK